MFAGCPSASRNGRKRKKSSAAGKRGSTLPPQWDKRMVLSIASQAWAQRQTDSQSPGCGGQTSFSATHRDGENAPKHRVAGNHPVAFVTQTLPSRGRPERQARKGRRGRLSNLFRQRGKAKRGQGALRQTLLLPAFPVPPLITEIKRLSSRLGFAVFMLFLRCLNCALGMRGTSFSTQSPFAFNFACFFLCSFRTPTWSHAIRIP